MSDQQSFIRRWNTALHTPVFLINFIITMLLLLVVVIFIPHYFIYIQERNGRILHDPLLDLIGPADVSWITFSFIYGSLAAALISLFFFPLQLLRALQGYLILTFFRMVTLYLLPLNEPLGLIHLKDPLVDIIGYSGKVITKDLFFSGHVSTLFLFYLAVVNRQLKKILLLTTTIVAFLILLQHVHYTIDVLAAPVFAWVAYKCAGWVSGIRFQVSGISR